MDKGSMFLNLPIGGIMNQQDVNVLRKVLKDHIKDKQKVEEKLMEYNAIEVVLGKLPIEEGA